jgi:4-hydroxy-3-polyprenylbenzoate decarboxylase
MAYRDIHEYIKALKEQGELIEIEKKVSPELEITEIYDRIVKKGPNKALLFKNVQGSKYPVLINAFGSEKRMRLAIGREPIEVGEDIIKVLKGDMPRGFIGALKNISKVKELLSYPPRVVSSGPCQEVEEQPDLDGLPILRCWPNDGGRFITLPLVFTHDPETGERNVGVYRMQVYDKRTTGMHWHVHKHGASHLWKAKKMKRKLDVAVVIGADPAMVFSGIAPVPELMDEVLFAGFIRKTGVDMVKCRTIDVQVPVNAEFVLEGYVDPEETRTEGPFGDHTGHYSLKDEYPVFHVTHMTRKKEPIYLTTVVGVPPQEDAAIGKAVERMFLPLIRAQLPEVVDMNLPVEGGFNNMAIVSIRKRYPGHARRVMVSLWGLGQLMFTKCIIVLDDDVNVQDLSQVLWATLNRADPKRDTLILDNMPADALDHSSPLPHLGSKMGIDATQKLKEEGYEREWPPVVSMDEKTKELVLKRWKEYGF